MCSKYALFTHKSLDEKTEPEERFIQAIEEYNTDGHLRTLLIKHFAKSWGQVFRSADTLEETLKAAQSGCNDAEKCLSFLLAKPVVEELRSNFHMMMDKGDWGRPTNAAVALVSFARDIALTCFSSSAYTLYSSGLKESLYNLDFHQFLSVFYSKDYLLSKALFDDEKLLSLGAEHRTHFLWKVFKALTEQCYYPLRSSTIDTSIDNHIEKLISALSRKHHQGPPTKCVYDFLRGIEFLKAWIQHDAQAGRLSIKNDSLMRNIDHNWFYELVGSLNSLTTTQAVTEEIAEAAEQWLRETRRELHTLFYCHTDVTSASETEKKAWASSLDEHFKNYFIDIPQRNSLELDEIKAREFEYLNSLCSQLTQSQVETWIEWTVETDFHSILNSDSKKVDKALKLGSKWWGTEYADAYTVMCEKSLSNQDSESQISILSARLNNWDFATSEAFKVCSEWWNLLFRGLLDTANFPKELLPNWITIAKSRGIDREHWIPHLDKSIGILRGRISTNERADVHRDLNELLPVLDDINPTKALRHRIMLIRLTTTALTDESISRFNTINDRDKAIQWDKPLNELAKNRAWNNSQSKLPNSASYEEQKVVEIESFTQFSCDLAEFCLSRLRLQKGQKAEKGKFYDEDQLIEPSQAWRRGYLKALTELGFDLNGKVHKAIHFIKQSDPNEEIRAIANECYRAVRRHSKKQRSLEELKRGIVAAEWWLLICQRLELNLDVDNEEALKTRRRLLRHPH
jgi:hypothetical protein